MSSIIYGSIKHKDKSYPFFLEGRRVNIVGAAWECCRDFQNIDEEKSIFGITSDNRQILFLKCRFSFSSLYQKVWFYPIGYVLSSGNIGNPYDFTFEKVSFYSDALNSFYPPQRAISTDFDWKSWDGSMAIKLKPFDETEISFDYKECTCKLNVSRYVITQAGKSNLGNINAVFSFELKSGIKQSCEELPQYYLALFDFLSFINYETNINFDKIVLYKRTEAGFSHCADAYIFSDQGEYLPKSPPNTITVDDIPLDKLETVFSKIAGLRENDKRLCYYFPKNYKERIRVDASRWLLKATTFEGLFRKCYPDFKQNKKEQFRTAKKVALTALNNIEQKQMSKGEQKYLNDCISQVERYEGLLKEIVDFIVKEKYKEELSDLLRANEKEFHLELNSYGEIYSEYRNKIAHGDIDPVGENEWAVYRVLQAVTYFMLFEGTGLSCGTLRTITKKLFL